MQSRYRFSRATNRILAAVVILFAWISAPVFAHDEHGDVNWITKGPFLSPDGSRCCGANDCAVVDPSIVNESLAGYDVNGVVRYTIAVWANGTFPAQWRYRPNPLDVNEFVPRGETLVSLDGKYWRCKRPNGARRCFFVPPKGM